MAARKTPHPADSLEEGKPLRVTSEAITPFPSFCCFEDGALENEFMTFSMASEASVMYYRYLYMVSLIGIFMNIVIIVCWGWLDEGLSGSSVFIVFVTWPLCILIPALGIWVTCRFGSSDPINFIKWHTRLFTSLVMLYFVVSVVLERAFQQKLTGQCQQKPRFTCDEEIEIFGLRPLGFRMLANLLGASLRTMITITGSLFFCFSVSHTLQYCIAAVVTSILCFAVVATDFLSHSYALSLYVLFLECMTIVMCLMGSMIFSRTARQAFLYKRNADQALQNAQTAQKLETEMATRKAHEDMTGYLCHEVRTR
jgi:hypothetical protein